MLSRKTIGVVAVITPFWFLAVYLIMAGLRPDYSFLHKAISELGSVGAPHAWFWNVLGYILPGLAIALLGLGLKVEFSGVRRFAGVPAYALVVSGLFMVLSGVFPGDFVNRGATTMIVHPTGAFGTYLAFLVAGFWLPALFRKLEAWRWVAWPSLALVIASIATGFVRSGATPGLGQRLTFTCFFLWVGLVGFALARSQFKAQSITIRSTGRSPAARVRAG